MTMQGKVLNQIKRVLEQHKLEAVESWAWANAGNLYVQSSDSLETLFTIHVSFQDGYMSARIQTPDQPKPKEEAFPHIEYTAFAKMQGFLAAVEREAQDATINYRQPEVAR